MLKKEDKKLEKELTNNKLGFFKNKKIIISLISILLLILAVIISIWNIQYVKVKFDTNGGNVIKSMYIKKGTQLQEQIVAEKLGHNFISWTYGDSNQVYELDDFIKDDITLLAQYEAKPESVYLEEMYENVSKDTVIKVHSLLELTDDNISEHISAKNVIDENVELKVKRNGNDIYTITAKNGWIEGYTYIIDILSLTQIEFDSFNDEKMGSNIHQITFNIFKEDK